jgi:integrase
MTPRARGQNVRKVCSCGWRRWPKCPHAWYFSFKPRGGQRYRFSLDAELGKHFESKSDAENAAAPIRTAILAGTFRRTAVAGPEPSPPSADGVTLDQFAEAYIDRKAKASGKRSWANDVGMLARLREFRPSHGPRLGQWPMTTITEDALEAFFSSLSAFAASTRNQYVQVLKGSFRWAAKKGYIQRSPVTDDSALKRTKMAQRRRRVLPDEEKALLDAAGGLTRGAGPRLQWLIIAAIETGCRRGELLALQWGDINLTKRTFLVRAVDVGARKTGRSRLLPISARLAATFEMAKLDPARRKYPASAYVFGAMGTQLKTIKKAWERVVLTAHGHHPEIVEGKLSPASRQHLRAINLHFHDLRHEAGCRWLEAGWPIHHVQEMLGHTNLSQTSTYLHAAEMGLQESMKRFDVARGKTVAKSEEKEHPLPGHVDDEADRNDLLH